MKNTKTNNTEKNSVGRPKYQPKFPKSLKWTFDDWCKSNGVDPKTGKGAKCSSITLNNFKKSDMYTEKGNVRNSSVMVEVKGELAKSKSACGLGRKMKLYMLRSNLNKIAKPVATAKPVEVNIGTENSTPTSPVIDQPVQVETAPVAAIVEPTTIEIPTPEQVAVPIETPELIAQ